MPHSFFYPLPVFPVGFHVPDMPKNCSRKYVLTALKLSRHFGVELARCKHVPHNPKRLRVDDCVTETDHGELALNLSQYSVHRDSKRCRRTVQSERHPDRLGQSIVSGYHSFSAVRLQYIDLLEPITAIKCKEESCILQRVRTLVNPGEPLGSPYIHRVERSVVDTESQLSVFCWSDHHSACAFLHW